VSDQSKIRARSEQDQSKIRARSEQDQSKIKVRCQTKFVLIVCEGNVEEGRGREVFKTSVELLGRKVEGVCVVTVAKTRNRETQRRERVWWDRSAKKEAPEAFHVVWHLANARRGDRKDDQTLGWQSFLSYKARRGWGWNRRTRVNTGTTLVCTLLGVV